MNTRVETSNHEVLSTAQRVLDPLISIVAVGFVLSFFSYHQFAQTGFFTARFGAFEMLCFYGPIVLSLIAPIARGVSGRRNPGRPLEAITQVCMALAALWLLQVFPFNFTHLADALPTTLRFVLAWVTDDIGKIVLLLQVVVGALAALLTTMTYFVVHVRASAIASNLRFRRHQPV